jgi:hypothetical protein
MAWSDISTIRYITGLTDDTFTDGQIQDFICLAQKEINSKLSTKITREIVEYIDKTRENKIDNSNTTYYVKNWKGNYLSDLNYDSEIDVNDIKIYSVASDGTETALTAYSIDYDNCSFTLSTAPTNVTLYIDYSYIPFDPVTPHPFLQQVTSYLASSYMYVNDDDSNIRFGNVSISSSGTSNYNKFYDKYERLMNELNESITNGAIWGISKVQI